MTREDHVASFELTSEPVYISVYRKCKTYLDWVENVLLKVVFGILQNSKLLEKTTHLNLDYPWINYFGFGS